MTTEASVAPTVETDHLNRGSIGVGGIVFFVVAAAAPLLVMAGVAPLAIGALGIGAPGGYLIAGLSLLVFAAAFTAMSKYIRNAGAFYSYISRGFTHQWGLGAAVLALFSYNAVEIGIFGAFGYFADGAFADVTGVDLPWVVWAFLAIGLVWFLGSRSAHVGARVLGFLLVAETGILLLLAVAVLAKGGAQGLSLKAFAPSNVCSPGLGPVLTLAFAAFIGFEATAIYREEARDPERTIPRATYVAVAFLGGFYAFMVWIIIQAYGPQHAVEVAATDPAGMFFKAIESYVGQWASTTMEVLILTSVLASLLAFHNTITRYTYALSREHILPGALSRLHPVHASPHMASAAQTALAALVVAVFAAVGADPYFQLLLWVNSLGLVGIVVLQAMAAGAVLVFFWDDRRGHSAWRVVAAPVASIGLLGMATYLIVTQMQLLTSAGALVNAILVAITPACLVTGYVLGARLKRRRPDLYAQLGTTDIDAEQLA
jgi:amino acid transporter